MLRMLELTAQGLKPQQVIDAVVRETRCSEPTAWRTWRDRDEWMPKLVKAPEGLEELTTDLLRDIREARRLALNLYYQTPGGNAKVGALRVAVEAALKEAVLRQSLGQLEKVPDQVKVEVGIPDITDEEIARYVPIVFKVALDQQTRESNEDAAQEDPTK